MSDEPSSADSEGELSDVTVKLEVDRTVRLDTGTAALEPVAEVSREKTGLLFSGLSLKKRKDVDSVIESLRDRHPVQEVVFSGEEEALEFLEDNYDLGAQFAEGGQGTLSAGFDRKLQRLVAVKSLKRGFDGNGHLRGQFVTEARVTAQLDHPAIVPIYTLNSDRKSGLHLAMKLIKGENFKDYLEQVVTHYRLDGVTSYDEQKSLRYRLDVFLKVCDALEYAHSRNVMHRDLKPANIMIGEYRETYIMDWGIARRIGDADCGTEKKEVFGTPQYLAPEIIEGRECDQRADIFAMGAILFEVAALKTAFTGKSVQSLIENIRCGHMEAIEHRFHVRIDADLKAIIRKATAAKQEERYQRIEELSRDLRRYLMGQEVSAKPDNPVMKAIRWCYNHRRMTLIFLLVALLIGAGALSFSLYREFRFSEEMRARDYALGLAYSVCTQAGYQLDEQFLKLEQMTDSLAADVQFLLEYDVHKVPHGPGPEKRAFHSVAELKDGGFSGMAESAFHCGPVGLAAVAFNTTADTDQEKLEERLEPISRFIPRLLQTILESPVDAQVTTGNLKQLTDSALLNGTPIIRVLFGFSDGLYVAYPASSRFPRIYDPRSRIWYRQGNGSQNGEAVWSKPYIDSIPEIGLVISCSVPLHTLSGRGDGVCALDISLSELIEEMHTSGNSGSYVMEKAIVDNTGQIIASTTKSFAEVQMHSYSSADEEPVFSELEDKTLLSDMTRRKFGVKVTRDSNGVEVVYAFCHIRSVDWFYVEKMNLAHMESAAQEWRARRDASRP